MGGRKSMFVLAHTFGINHAAVTTPILYQSSYFGQHLGNLNNTLLYGITMVTALFLAPVLNDRLGPRLGLAMSMTGYAIYVAMFAAALLCPHDTLDSKDVDPGALMYLLGVAGSVIGGLSAGPLWTFQGVVVGKIVESVAEAEGKQSTDVSAEMMGTFGWWFLFWEAVMRVFTTLLLKLHVPAYAVFFVFAVLAFAATLYFYISMPPLVSSQQPGPWWAKALKAIRLWRDPKLWLLQFTNITFGFGAAWNASYVGSNFTSVALSADFIGFTGALISLIGGLGSKLLAPLAKAVGKSIIILFGALAFFGIAFLSRIIKDGSGMGLSVLIFPTLMGIGRAVYESTNKGVFLDFYPDPATHPGVFSNVMMFGTLSSSVVFILDMTKLSNVVIYLLFIFSVSTFPCIAMAACYKSREERHLQLPINEK